MTATLLDAAGAEVLRYSDLYVVDAAGKELPAELRAREGALAIWFDDRDATYPVTVDPLITIQQQMLTASDKASGDQFGQSVAVSGDTAVVGAYRRSSSQGAAYVFVRSGTVWTEQQKLTSGETSTGRPFRLVCGGERGHRGRGRLREVRTRSGVRVRPASEQRRPVRERRRM